MVVDPLKIERNGKPIDLQGLWSPNPGFLVCSGPSMNDHPLERLRERGVVSLGVNQAAAWAPVKAWTFSDPQCKFHHGLFFDPDLMTFAPGPKLRWKVIVKTKDGFRESNIKGVDCPNTFGYRRKTMFVPRTFFDTPEAHWGPSKHQPEGEPRIGTLCTMLIGIRLMYYLGCRRIYLIGVDFKGRDGLCYAWPCRKKERNRRYKLERAMLEALQPAFKERGLELYNCYRRSACDLFDYVPFDLAVEDCKGGVPDEPFDTRDWYNKAEVKKQYKGQEPCKVKHF